ncbi:FixH family protein [Microbulbifer spongiae]|uniref:FixH family protein n=1 Tax=Microbulbifer spongiae TaxID=2944933 RepID=A0ABY9EBU8_9GAMM|nr:FixH family protein [Microbulbifer sp. MI-G]WKD48934.1 FixH family protein [Microbulbifer sp. MI-G]
MRAKVICLHGHIAMCLFFSLMAKAIESNTPPEIGTPAASSQTMLHIGEQLLHNAEAAQAESVSLSLHSNRLRKSLNQLRRQWHALPQGRDQPLLKHTMHLVAEEIPLWQEQVSRLRNQALDQRGHALTLLEKAFIQIWRPHIRLTDRIRGADSDSYITGHNSNIRSVHPGKMNMAVATEARAPTADMSLEIPALSGQNIPGELNLSSFRISRKLSVFAHIEPETATTLVPLNQIHQWRLILSQLNGQPLRGAEISIEGHMPGHVHGLPTQPRVTEEMAPGIYRVQGVKFQMPGWWVMTFHIRVNQQDDAVTFNIRL